MGGIFTTMALLIMVLTLRKSDDEESTPGPLGRFRRRRALNV